MPMETKEYFEEDIKTENGGKLKAQIQSIYEGVKYTCNQCDKQFRRQTSLKIIVLAVIITH